MNQASAAYDSNRLPWLPDEPLSRSRRPLRAPGPGSPRSTSSWPTLLPWTLLGLLLVAGLSYWFGMRSMQDQDLFADSNAPGATLTLPEPAESNPLPMREVEEPQVVAPVLAEPEEIEAAKVPVRPGSRIDQPAASLDSDSEEEQQDSTAAEVDATAEAMPKPVAPPKKLELWPVREVDGSEGRLVRIGTFSNARQAKRGWWRLMRAYPGMRRLKALVVPVQSLRNNRDYYRLQFGTTSQAHSTVLCQRMRMIGQSCVVIGAGARQASASAAPEKESNGSAATENSASTSSSGSAKSGK